MLFHLGRWILFCKIITSEWIWVKNNNLKMSVIHPIKVLTRQASGTNWTLILRLKETNKKYVYTKKQMRGLDWM